ncbi:aspartyl-phosphate phosphatase Spo0E family protein [Caloramator sp. E03]|uniref:aspartyl-phosphate phosphatase Spo0E family protein n=1 Tax=Caloramator sp. E03 TaxID=2576307 RepID=UPI001110B912|nr:aspartyl-phosphate phosphatase Spo0E family protein [Caloramator sp. E03]QCX32258.1 aspartyl-phosphate phosphatase Spo0E family protein [Caloramator sp. E03]
MGDVQRIKNHIEKTRKYLYELIKVKGNLTDEEIVLISQELDKAINVYYKVQKTKLEGYSYI